MGWFFSSGKRIKRKELERILRETPSLGVAEREYVKGVFAKYLSGGVSKTEATRAIHELKRQMADVISTYEADELHARLLRVFDGE
ncbi:hypothetical protein HY634_01280 [Candidatus Uhrbacteria bacterium]|nr:hypothetical protein [Candidatus Uhrbacteria bacterium]